MHTNRAVDFLNTIVASTFPLFNNMQRKVAIEGGRNPIREEVLVVIVATTTTATTSGKHKHVCKNNCYLCCKQSCILILAT